MDISADLIELGRTPMGVVCAGAKSILDIPRTLEVLETQGVCVASYGQKEFPAFYTPSYGINVSANLFTSHPNVIMSSWVSEDRLRLMIVVTMVRPRCQGRCQLNPLVHRPFPLLIYGQVVRQLRRWLTRSDTGLNMPNPLATLLAVPPPPSETGEKVQAAVEQAVKESVEQGIDKRGKEATPWLLKRVGELTGGSALNLSESTPFQFNSISLSSFPFPLHSNLPLLPSLGLAC